MNTKLNNRFSTLLFAILTLTSGTLSICAQRQSASSVQSSNTEASQPAVKPKSEKGMSGFFRRLQRAADAVSNSPQKSSSPTSSANDGNDADDIPPRLIGNGLRAYSSISATPGKCHVRADRFQQRSSFDLVVGSIADVEYKAVTYAAVIWLIVHFYRYRRTARRLRQLFNGLG